MRQRARICLVVSALGVASLGLLAPQAMADSLVWGQPVPIDPGHGMRGVSCATSAVCVAVDNRGNIVSSTDPAGGAAAWTVHPAAANSTNALEGISCPSTTLCLAYDQYGTIRVSTAPTDPAAQWSQVYPGSPSITVAGVSCPSTTLCVAIDGVSGDAATTTTPAGPSSGWTVATIDASNQLEAVSCATTALCVVGGSGHDVVSSTNPTGGAAAWHQTVLSGSSPVDGLDCPTITLCLTSSLQRSVDPAAPTPTWAMVPNFDMMLRYGNAIDCFQQVRCVMFGRGYATTTNEPTGDGSSFSEADVDGSAISGGVSCPSVDFCAIVDYNGNLITGLPSGQTRPAGSTPPPSSSAPGGPTTAPGSSGSDPASGQGTGTTNPGSGAPGPSGTTTTGSGAPGPSGTTTTTTTAAPVPSAASVPAALLADLAAGSLSIAKALKAREIDVPFRIASAGEVGMTLYLVPPGAHVARKVKPRPIAVATGKAHAAKAGKGTLRLKLTTAGRKLLKHAKSLKLTAKATFTPTGKKAASKTRTLTLKR